MISGGRAPSPSNDKNVASFRREYARLPLHTIEKTLVTLLGIQLCFLPWALGSMHGWSQLVSLVLSAAAFVLALLPREYTGDLANGEDFLLVMWPRLVRFPLFWLGLALLVYIATQAFNPSWAFARNATQWWLVRIPDVPWLPTSIDVPWARFSVWRQFVIYASAWLVVCAVWTGLTRRRSLHILLMILLANGLVLGVLLSAQRATGNPRMPWPLTAWTDAGLSASFIYKNHAGAYLGLIATLAASLAIWFFEHGERTLKKSTPASALAFVTVFLGGTVAFTFSRAALAIFVLTLVLLAAWWLLRWKHRGPGGPSGLTVPIAVSVVFVALLLNGLRFVDFSAVVRGFDRLVNESVQEESAHARVLATQAAGTMLSKHWVRGVGAGGFRHLFPEYVKAYPEIHENGRLFWEHAHDDWLQIPIELGLTGSLLIAGGLGWGIVWFARRRILWHPIAAPLLLGCGQTLVHACVDFPFQCPAILITWCVLVTISGRWIDLEAPPLAPRL